MARSNQDEEIGAMKSVTPVEYMQKKFPAVEFTVTFNFFDRGGNIFNFG